MKAETCSLTLKQFPRFSYHPPLPRFSDLHHKNIPLMQQVDVPHAWGQLEMQANGTGYALFGISHEMYVEHEYQFADWAPPLTQKPELVGKTVDVIVDVVIVVAVVVVVLQLWVLLLFC